jgi:endo-1,4-beta-xylanase
MKEEGLLAGANERIRRYRTADLAVEVTDKRGHPLPRAQVEVRQTRHEYLFGCHLFVGGRDADQEKEAYRKHFEALFNYASLGFAWARFEPEPGQPRYEHMNRLLEWCEARKMTCQGHLVMWNHDVSSPSWLPDDPAEIIKQCDARVSDLVSHYRGRIRYWILVNEVTDCFREESVDKAAYRTAVTRAWRHEGKVPFAKRFFPIAHTADPAARLLINDYRVDEPYEELIEQLVDDRGRPLYDAVGLQSHMHYRYWGAAKTWDVCERFARFGKPLHFTENTQISGRGRRGSDIQWANRDPDWRSTKSGEARQAKIAAELYTVIFSHPATQAITWFELVDYGWLGAPGGLLHAEDLSPKPAYEKLHGLIKGEWWTEAAAETNGNGRCSVRAFYGDYAISAQRGDAKATVEYRHTKGATVPVRVVL